MIDMNASATLIGFNDPVRQSQAAFRKVMEAMANPGTLFELDVDFAPPSPLMAGTAVLALTLCDFESTVWLDPTFAAAGPVREFLAFHTGAPLVAQPSDAAFAFIADAAELPSLSRFSYGSLEYPDRSTTLVVQSASLAATGGLRLTGPGIPDEAYLAVGSIPAAFADERRVLRANFPLGVDVIFVAGTTIAALPRSTFLA
jgi:alpha-D-ribose 1-methylphosphonate 5-triphosphate synthase subunit PhnH